MPIPAVAGCPEDDPNCPITPPQSQEVDTSTSAADGSQGEVSLPGGLTPIEFVVPMPRLIEPVPLAPPLEKPYEYNTLPVRMRYQDPVDLSCGVSADLDRSGCFTARYLTVTYCTKIMSV